MHGVQCLGLGFPEIGGTFFGGVPIIRITVFWGVLTVPLLRETTTWKPT